MTRRPTGARRPGDGDTAAVAIATRDYLPRVRALAASLAEHHAGLPFVVVVADWDPAREPAPAGDWRPLAGRDLDVPSFARLALLHPAAELCCRLKPFAVAHLHAAGFERVLYLDGDLLVTAALDELLAALDEAGLVVTPHQRAPFPLPERPWEHPAQVDVLAAGPLNAGLFASRAGPDSERFLAHWGRLNTAPCRGSERFAGEAEQLAFNWIQAYAGRVYVLRDPGYNAAYWNLHERPLARAGGRLTAGGRPLRVFHFSGFDPAAPWRLSRWDNRCSSWEDPCLAELLADYAARLAGAGAPPAAAVGYGFGAFPSGARLTDAMRRALRDAPGVLPADLDAWTPEGERQVALALFSPAPTTGSLLPLLVQRTYSEREDLRRAHPGCELEPRALTGWISSHGLDDLGARELYEAHRDALPAPGSPLTRLREIWEHREDLRRAMPDPLGDDATRFAEWVRVYGVREHGLATDDAERFLARANGRALARIFSFLSRQWHLMRLWPLALVGVGARGLAPVLLRLLEVGPEYDADDVVAYLWTVEARPWTGLGLTLELPAVATRLSPPPGAEDRRRLFADLAARDVRFAAELEAHLEGLAERWRGTAAPGPAPDDLEERTESAIDRAPSALRPGRGAPGRPSARRRLAGLRPGVNLFGCHKSPIGLGTQSRGLARALDAAGVEVRTNLLANLAMDADLAPADIVDRFDPRLAANVFVHFPHHPEHLLTTHPWWMVEGRQNVAYLAWEQRDAHPIWRHAFDDYDQVWALSGFAAASLGRGLERQVAVVPCVLDRAELPEPVERAELGLDPDTFLVVFVFDANSSIERKNPEAAVAAFTRAFTPREPAELLIRIHNARSPVHRGRIEQLERSTPAGARVRFATGDMDRAGVLRRIAAADAYLSLHRAEGFGYTCAEAMAYGRPVVASRYSGNLEFMTDANSFLVDCREVEVTRSDGPFRAGSVWAEPDLDQAAAQLRRIYEDRGEAVRRGELGRLDVLERLSPAAVGATAARWLGLPAPARTP